MNKDIALKLALKELVFYRDWAQCQDWRDESQTAITAIKEALAQETPACPQGIIEFACELEGVDLVCHLEYIPEELGSLDSHGLSNEPDYAETMELVSAYIKGTDIDIGHLLLQGLVDHITTTALEDYKNDDL